MKIEVFNVRGFPEDVEFDLKSGDPELKKLVKKYQSLNELVEALNSPYFSGFVSKDSIIMIGKACAKGPEYNKIDITNFYIIGGPKEYSLARKVGEDSYTTVADLVMAQKTS